MASFEEAMEWAAEGSEEKVALLLGNGFSIAYNPEIFTYDALASRAENQNLLPPVARRLMEETGKSDFESIMRTLQGTLDTLVSLDAAAHRALIDEIEGAVAAVREALAVSVAGLHPNRPFEISESSYLRVRAFLDRFKSIYTVSYDLLTYWALMQDFDGLRTRSSDDGFRDSGVENDDTVLWDMYDAHHQNLFYLHGALHLYVGRDGLRKMTYARTQDALVDQIRRQLAVRRYPLYVAEGLSADKVARINGSAYLSRALRSFSGRANPLIVFGHSLDENDDHIFEGLVRSKVKRLAISLHGDPSSQENQIIQRRAEGLRVRRAQRWGDRHPLAIYYFDAASVPLWHSNE